MMRGKPAFLLVLLGLMGCKPEQEIVPKLLNSVAVTTGDFDRVATPLDRMVVDHTEYEGLISTATWDATYDPQIVALKVETLFSNFDELNKHDTVFIASGTRGLGEQQYNGLLMDDHIVTDEVVLENVSRYVGGQGTLLATDWSYDLVEAAFPDYIDFLDDDSQFDRAQAGVIGTVIAEVTEPVLANAIDSNTLALSFNYSNWAVIEEVEDDVTVWLRGDVEYRRPTAEGNDVLTDVPLLVSFSPFGADRGTVVYSAFHLDAQTGSAMDEILRTVVGNFKEGTVDPEAIEN